MQELNKEFDKVLIFEDYASICKPYLNLNDEIDKATKRIGTLINAQRKKKPKIYLKTKNEIKKSVRNEYEALINKGLGKTEIKTRFSDETKYVTFKLIDNDSPLADDIVRIVNSLVDN